MRERMAPVDTAWLRMDRENHLMAIKGVLVLEARLTRAALERLLTDRLLHHFPRFSQRVVQDEHGAWWETAVDFRLVNHLRRRRLPAGDGHAGLQALISRLASEPLPPHRPLWAVEWVERFGSGSALIVRVHHCMADGLALMALMRALTDAQPSPESCADELPPWLRAPEAQRVRGAGEHDEPRDRGAGIDHGEAPSGRRSADDPLSPEWQHLLGRWLQDPQATARLGQAGGLLASDVLKLLVLPQDSPTRLKGRTRGRKALAWSAPLPLGEVKAAAAALGCSVNDVLLSCVAGGLRRYLAQQGDDVSRVNIRTLVPVSLRSSSARRLGNRFGFAPLLLPLCEPNLLARVTVVSERMQELKHSLLPPLSLGLLGVLGLMPRSVQGAALDLLASRATAVVTNVPGPRSARWLAGVRIKDLMFWVPQSGDVGLGVSIITYGDTIRIGLICDAGLVGDPSPILESMQQDFKHLLLALLLCADTPLPDATMFERWLQQRVDSLDARA
jgi:WS/DGAT/MGAT family acyltransferase